MNLARAILLFTALISFAAAVNPTPQSATIGGRVTFTGTPPKAKPIDMSKQPECTKLHPEGLSTEELVVGGGKALKNVVVYVSAGPPDTSPVPTNTVNFDQQGCRYTTHVLAFRAGQDVRISNSDPFVHNIHPLAKVNREWNRIQLPGTPPFTYSYEIPEFITVKCNIHAWMRANFVVLKTSHFDVTGDDGRFELPNLSPGHYTVTAWHETLGTLYKEINVGPGGPQTADFVFP